MVVSCLSDGVQVEIHITERGFNGMLYVKGHSKDENCRRFVTLDQDTSSKLEIFKVTFGNCGLIHSNARILHKWSWKIYNLFIYREKPALYL